MMLKVLGMAHEQAVKGLIRDLDVINIFNVKSASAYI